MLSSDTLLQNRYRIIRLLGQGGMGAVYLAIDERLGHEVALKQMFHPQRDLLAQAFEREARILARLNHRCLPKVSDHFLEGGSHYLVMQYIGGADLGNLLEKNERPFPPEQVLIWADSLLDALEYLHNHDPSILHRDIKPQNLKINQDGELFLLDFGLAKDTAVNTTSSSSPSSVLGYSLNYSPLEQIDRQRTSVETDIYAACATLYHLSTNELPADALTRLSARANALPDPLIPANQINPQVSEELANALQRGLILRREDRIQAAELRRLLRKLSPYNSNPFNANPFSTKLFESKNLNDSGLISAQESPNQTFVPLIQTVTEPSTNILPLTTKIDSVPVVPQPKVPAAKQRRSFLPLAIGLIVLLCGAGLSAAIIGYNKFVVSPTPSPLPIPASTVQNIPAAAPTTAENFPVPPANTFNQNIREIEEPKTTTNQNSNQTSNQNVKQIEKQLVPNAPAPKPAATQNVNPPAPPPKPVPPQKANPPIKNSGGGKKDKKDKAPPVIIPY